MMRSGTVLLVVPVRVVVIGAVFGPTTTTAMMLLSVRPLLALHLEGESERERVFVCTGYHGNASTVWNQTPCT